MRDAREAPAGGNDIFQFPLHGVLEAPRDIVHRHLVAEADVLPEKDVPVSSFQPCFLVSVSSRSGSLPYVSVEVTLQPWTNTMVAGRVSASAGRVFGGIDGPFYQSEWRIGIIMIACRISRQPAMDSRIVSRGGPQTRRHASRACRKYRDGDRVPPCRVAAKPGSARSFHEICGKANCSEDGIQETVACDI